METMITIPYDDFKEMLEKMTLYNSFKNDLVYLIREAELDYYKKDLDIGSTVKEFAKKYCSNIYKEKLWSLQKELNQKESE